MVCLPRKCPRCGGSLMHYGDCTCRSEYYVFKGYPWRRWFAWYPIKRGTGWGGPLWFWLGWIWWKPHGEVAPNGDLTDWIEYRVSKTQPTD